MLNTVQNFEDVSIAYLDSIRFVLLTIIIIANFIENTSGNIAQNYGKNFVQFASHFSLDKLCEVCYNGNFGASSIAGAPRNKKSWSIDQLKPFVL